MKRKDDKLISHKSKSLNQRSKYTIYYNVDNFAKTHFTKTITAVITHEIPHLHMVLIE